MVRSYSIKDVVMGRLREGDDLLESLINVVRDRGIGGGAIQLIGSLKRVRVGFFNRDIGSYEAVEDSGFFELVSGVGNISWRDGEPVVHVHIAAVSRGGRILLGHLLPGNIVDATVEFTIYVLDGRITRSFDEDTNLYLLDL
jgi:hypothetical protein